MAKRKQISQKEDEELHSERRRVAKLLEKGPDEPTKPVEKEKESGRWETVNIHLEKITKSESGRAGLILTILALVGLILCFGGSWFYEEGDGGKSYKYGDFGKEIEDDFGRDFDSYYHKSAKMAVFSLIFLLLCGIALIIHSRTNILVKLLNVFFSREEMGNEYQERAALRLITASLILLPSVYIATSGSRFVGFVMFSSKGHVSGESLSHVPDGSVVGVGLLIIGILLFMIIVYYIYLTLPEFMKLIEHKKKKYSYLRSCQHFAEVVFLLSAVALVTLSLMPTLKIIVEKGTENNTYQDEIYLSDGFTGVEIYDEKEGFNKLHKDFQILKFFLHLMLLVSFLSFAGTLLFPFPIKKETSHFLLSLISLALFAAVFILLMYFFIFSHASSLEDQLSKSPTVVDAQVKFSYNFLPVGVALIILALSSRYIFEIYQNSIKLFLRI